jgi:hypothetical protein
MADDGANVDLTLATGLTLNAAPSGSLLIRNEAAAVVLSYRSNAVAFMTEGLLLPGYAKEFVVGQKLATASNIRFVHTTTDAPSTGGITWWATWVPLSATGKLTAAA